MMGRSGAITVSGISSGAKNRQALFSVVSRVMMASCGSRAR